MSRLSCRVVLWILAIGLIHGAMVAGEPGSRAKAKPARKPIEIPDSVVVERDVVFGDAGGRPLLLDLVRPREPRRPPLPVIVFIHGGGFHAGDKAGGVRALLPFVASGKYLGISVAYRLTGEAIWPAQIHDCKAAIRWIRANAARYHADPEKIGAWGGSAGGHLVAMLAVTGDFRALEGNCGSPGVSSRLTCAVDSCGPTDMVARARERDAAGKEDGGLNALLGGAPLEKLALAREASPMTYVSKDAAALLIIHGTADPVIPFHHSQIFYDALKKAGADATFVKVEGGGHGGGPQVKPRIQDFFAKHLRGEKVEVSDEPIVSSKPEGKQPRSKQPRGKRRPG